MGLVTHYLAWIFFVLAPNLAKFRKAQQELEEVEERAKLAALI